MLYHDMSKIEFTLTALIQNMPERVRHTWFSHQSVLNTKWCLKHTAKHSEVKHNWLTDDSEEPWKSWENIISAQEKATNNTNREQWALSCTPSRCHGITSSGHLVSEIIYFITSRKGPWHWLRRKEEYHGKSEGLCLYTLVEGWQDRHERKPWSLHTQRESPEYHKFCVIYQIILLAISAWLHWAACLYPEKNTLKYMH